MRGIVGACGAAVASIVVVVASCADPGSITEPPTSPASSTVDLRLGAPERGPAAFELTALPDGYTVDRALDGTTEPTWSSDSFGGLHPYVVVVPDDWSGIADRRWITVAVIDGSGNEGGFGQELPGYIREAGQRPRTINGHPAVVATGSEGTDGTDPVPPFVAINTSTDGGDVEAGDRTGLLVTGPGATVDELLAVAGGAAYVEPHTPDVTTVPRGWRILGRTTAAQVGVTRFGNDDRDVLVGQRALVATGPEHNDDTAVRVTAVEGDGTTPVLVALGAAGSAVPRSTTAVTPFTSGDVTGFTRSDEYTTTAWFAVDGNAFVADIARPVVDAGFGLDRLVSGLRITDDDGWSAQRAATRNSLGQPIGTIALAFASDDTGDWAVGLPPGPAPLPPTTVLADPQPVDPARYFSTRRVELALNRPGEPVHRAPMTSSTSTSGMSAAESFYVTSTSVAWPLAAGAAPDSTGAPGGEIDVFVFVATPGPATTAELDVDGVRTEVSLEPVAEVGGLRCGTGRLRFPGPGPRVVGLHLVQPDGTRSVDELLTLG